MQRTRTARLRSSALVGFVGLSGMRGAVAFAAYTVSIGRADTARPRSKALVGPVSRR